jgi:hypothetical protein
VSNKARGARALEDNVALASPMLAAPDANEAALVSIVKLSRRQGRRQLGFIALSSAE